MLLLYVDDLFVTGTDGLIVDTKRKIASKFERKDLCMMHYFLGMEVSLLHFDPKSDGYFRQRMDFFF